MNSLIYLLKYNYGANRLYDQYMISTNKKKNINLVQYLCLAHNQERID
jgi:hypothetical protein